MPLVCKKAQTLEVSMINSPWSKKNKTDSFGGGNAVIRKSPGK